MEISNGVEPMNSNAALEAIGQKFPAGTLICLGVRILRHKTEEKLKLDEWQKLPENERADLFVETWLDVSGLTYEESVQRGGGDTPVTYQKICRGDVADTTLGQLNVWRRAMLASYGRNKDGFLRVVLDPKANSLNVPLQPIDKLLELIKDENLRTVLSAHVQDFENPTDAELRFVSSLYDSMKAALK